MYADKTGHTYSVYPTSHKELDNNILIFCDEIKNQAVEIFYTVYITLWDCVVCIGISFGYNISNHIYIELCDNTVFFFWDNINNYATQIAI